MTPYTIKNLYSEYRATFVNKQGFIVSFFEKNAIFFNNIKQFSDKEELRMYIEIIEKYIGALSAKGRYNNAINLVEKYQVVIDTEIKRLHAEELKNEWYYSLYFIKGIVSFNLKDYKTATRVFKTLVLVDGQNEAYKKWLDYAKYGKRQWLIYFILALSFPLCMGGLFFRKYIPSYEVRMLLDALGILLALFALSYDYYMKRSLRNKEKVS